MAEQSKRERRDAAREARRVAEEQAAAAAAKARVKTTVITVVSLAFVGGLVFLAMQNVRGKGVESAILIDRAGMTVAFDAAGCEVLAQDTPNDGAAEHIDPAVAPPADAMYPFDIRPAHSGPHFAATLPLITAGASNQLEERSIVHNYEHGAISIWYDPEQVGRGDISSMESFSETMNDSGFAARNSGAGIFVSPYTEPGISSGKAVAYRAWGQAMDCDEFSVEAAQYFIRENYGTEGIGPEGSFSPYPYSALAYEDEASTATDAPVEPGGDLGTMAPSETSTDGTSTDGTDAPSQEPTGGETTSEDVTATEPESTPSATASSEAAG